MEVDGRVLDVVVDDLGVLLEVGLRWPAGCRAHARTIAQPPAGGDSRHGPTGTPALRPAARGRIMAATSPTGGGCPHDHRLRRPHRCSEPAAGRAPTRSCSSPAATCATPPTAPAGRPSRSSRRTSPPPSPSTASASGARHGYDPAVGHGFIWNQRMGMDVFAGIHPDAPGHRRRGRLGVHPPRAGRACKTQRGPILTAANWSGQWPGLVGPAQPQRLHDQGGHGLQLHLERGLHRRVRAGGHQGVGDAAGASPTTPPTSAPWTPARLPAAEAELGRALAAQLQRDEGRHGRLRRRLHGHVQRHLR